LGSSGGSYGGSYNERFLWIEVVAELQQPVAAKLVLAVAEGAEK